MNNIKTKMIRFFSIIICIVMTGSSLLIPSIAAYPITDLKLVSYEYNSAETSESDSEFAKKYLRNMGYAVVNEDLNRGVYGNYIYLGYKGNTGDPITDIKAVKNGNGQNQIKCYVNGKVCTYYLVGDIIGNAIDLNQNAYGNPDVIYLYYTKDSNAGDAIVDLAISTNSSMTGYSTVTWTDSDSPADMNSGARRGTSPLSNDYPLYLHITRSYSTGERYSDGYNFLEDSYKFANNIAPNLSKKYFTTIFESGTADLMYKKHHKTGGLCYGMAYTTAAIYNGLPDVSRFSYLDGWTPKQATKIRDLSRASALGSKVVVGGNYNDFLELSDYIKYAFIYQYSVEANELLYQTANDAFGLLDTVKNFTNNNRIGVVVGFSLLKNHPDPKAPAGHEVLAVGYDGNDILIDNPNNTKSPERLTIHSDGSWEFGNYNSDNHVLDYATNIQRPYQILITGNKVVGKTGNTTRSSSIDEDEKYIEGMERLDADYTLVSIDATNFTLSSTDYIQLPENSKDGLDDNDSTAKLFWIKDSKTIKIDGLTDDVNTIEYGGDDTVISAVVSADSTVELTIDGDTKTAAVNTEKDKINTLTFSVVDDDGNKKGVEISGTASGDLVTAKKTENGITVDGLNDMTITYLKDEEEVSDKKAEVKDGREVNITVDDNEETVDTDFVPDSTKCKYCGKVHGDSFIEVMIKFFHKIFYFFAKLFGKM